MAYKDSPGDGASSSNSRPSSAIFGMDLVYDEANEEESVGSASDLRLLQPPPPPSRPVPVSEEVPDPSAVRHLRPPPLPSRQVAFSEEVPDEDAWSPSRESSSMSQDPGALSAMDLLDAQLAESASEELEVAEVAASLDGEEQPKLKPDYVSLPPHLAETYMPAEGFVAVCAWCSTPIVAPPHRVGSLLRGHYANSCEPCPSKARVAAMLDVLDEKLGDSATQRDKTRARLCECARPVCRCSGCSRSTSTISRGSFGSFRAPRTRASSPTACALSSAAPSPRSPRASTSSEAAGGVTRVGSRSLRKCAHCSVGLCGCRPCLPTLFGSFLTRCGRVGHLFRPSRDRARDLALFS